MKIVYTIIMLLATMVTWSLGYNKGYHAEREPRVEAFIEWTLCKGEHLSGECMRFVNDWDANYIVDHVEVTEEGANIYTRDKHYIGFIAIPFTMTSNILFQPLQDEKM